jgi:hypothetical protein
LLENWRIEMVITEEQAFMVITAMAVKEDEIQLCSDEYLFLIELAKFIDPERERFARNIKQWEKQAKLEKAAEESMQNRWEAEDENERQAEVHWESFYNH